MNTKLNYAMLPLVLLMALTRIHHFGSAFFLPDASLAVFFLAGFAFSSRYLVALLLLEAGIMDYIAINFMAVSDWCISPAYLFLIPTYFILWCAGRYCERFKTLTLVQMAFTSLALIIATTLAFIISNGSFYLFSGRYENLIWFDYATGVTPYFWSYFSSAFIYGVLGLIIIKIFKEFPVLSEREKEVL